MKQALLALSLSLGMLPCTTWAQRLTPEQKAHRAAVQQSIQLRKTIVSHDTIFHVGVPMGIIRPTAENSPTYHVSSMKGELVASIQAETVATLQSPAKMRYHFFLPTEAEADLPYQYGENAATLAERLVAWDVLTPQGWNTQGIARFIAAHPDRTPAAASTLTAKAAIPSVKSYSPLVVRNIQEAIYLTGTEIFQAGLLIGKYESMPSKENPQSGIQLTVSYLNGKPCATASYSLGGSQATLLSLTDQQQHTVSLEKFSEKESIIRYLIQFGYL